jgi:hypothetical protein
MATTRRQYPTGLAALKHDPKKAIVLVALVLVLAGMWGKMLLGGKGGPKAAAGMTIAPSAPSSVADSNNKAKAVDSIAQLRDWVAQPLPQDVSRNLFEVKLDYYPMDAAHAAHITGPVNDPTFWEKLAKSIDAQADQQHKRENLIQNLRQQAGQLAVTSTLMGPRPKAMVNGVMVSEGEFVAQFRVTEIRARSVIVEREGIKLEIAMK